MWFVQWDSFDSFSFINWIHPIQSSISLNFAICEIGIKSVEEKKITVDAVLGSHEPTLQIKWINFGFPSGNIFILFPYQKLKSIPEFIISSLPDRISSNFILGKNVCLFYSIHFNLDIMFQSDDNWLFGLKHFNKSIA